MTAYSFGFRRLSYATGPVLLVMVVAAASFICDAGAVPSRNKKRSTGGTSNTLLDRDLKVKRYECDPEVDPSLPSHERENLILACISQPCFDKIYGQDHLEEGEIDSVRGRHYRTCCRDALREERKIAIAAEKEEARKARQQAQAAEA